VFLLFFSPGNRRGKCRNRRGVQEVGWVKRSAPNRRIITVMGPLRLTQPSGLRAYNKA
jgi:hypothetical protein